MSDFLLKLLSVHFLCIEEHNPFSCPVCSVIQIFDSIEQIEGGLLPVLYTDESSAIMEQSLDWR